MALQVRDLGDGPPVVLLHPGPGLDGSVFLPHVQQLVDAGYRALLVDLPVDDFTLTHQAAAVEELMRELDAADPARPLVRRLRGHAAPRRLPGSAARRHRLVHGRRRGAGAGRAGGSVRGPAAPTSQAAFERESSVQTPEECREVWIDQMPFFAVEPGEGRADARRRRLQCRGAPRARPRRAARARGAGRGRHPGARHRRRAGAVRDGRQPSGSPRPPRAASWSSSRASATSRSPRRPTATGRR